MTCWTGHSRVSRGYNSKCLLLGGSTWDLEALQSRTEQNTQEQVAVPRTAGIAEQMKLGPAQGSCDRAHGAQCGIWGGYLTPSQWDIRGFIHCEGCWAEPEVLTHPQTLGSPQLDETWSTLPSVTSPGPSCPVTMGSSSRLSLESSAFLRRAGAAGRLPGSVTSPGLSPSAREHRGSHHSPPPCTSPGDTPVPATGRGGAGIGDRNTERGALAAIPPIPFALSSFAAAHQQQV